MKTIIKQIVTICILIIPIFTQCTYIECGKETPQTKQMTVVFVQEQSMVELEQAEQYVNAKIEERAQIIESYKARKEEWRTEAKESYEAYLASLRKRRQAPTTTYEQHTYTESTPSGSIGSYELTAYTWTGNQCANGEYPTAGLTIASNTLPLGTRVYIEGIGERVVQDTGGMGNGVIDIYMDSYDACIQFGRQSAEVYVLE